MLFNKPKKQKEPTRIGKPPENIQFKNSLKKKLNTSGYENIRNIVDRDEQAVSILQQGDNTHKNENKILTNHKKYSNNKKSK